MTVLCINVDIESTELLEGKFEDYSPRFDSFVICHDLQISNSLTVIFLQCELYINK